MKDLSPTIYRQRLIIEGICEYVISEEKIISYLSKLNDVCDMVKLTDPVTHKSDKYGWAAWIHWETSGTHFYAWDKPKPFFSVDIYTCKKFDAKKVIDFTKEHFKTLELEYKEV